MLVSSSDKYIDALDPFFMLFYKYYPNCEFDVVVNLEHNGYKYKNKNIKVFNIDKKLSINEISWSKRLINCLNQIDSKYIFLMLEDYFIRDYVDQDAINRHIDYLEKDKNMACISYVHYDSDNNIIDDRYYDLELRKNISKYKLNAGLNIWKKEFLLKYLGENENPWEFEAFANFRTFLYPNDRFYVISKNEKLPIDIGFEKRIWSPICKGKWYLPECEDLFKKENIVVDYEKMGICYEIDLCATTTKNKFIYTLKNSKIANRLRHSKLSLLISLILHLKYLNKKHK